jgi:Holliday junction resolvase RusA-like endonuclease
MGNSKYSFTIEGSIPSKKNRHIRYRNGAIGPDASYREWEDQAGWQLKGQKRPSTPLLKTVEISITIYPKTRRKADLDNKSTSILDLLVKMEILNDDSWFVVGRLVLELGGVDKQNPRCEIEIW